MTGLMRCCLQGLICTAPFGMKHPILGHGLKMKEAKTAIITPL